MYSPLVILVWRLNYTLKNTFMDFLFYRTHVILVSETRYILRLMKVKIFQMQMIIISLSFEL